MGDQVMSIYYDTLETPVGTLLIGANDLHLLSIMYDQDKTKLNPNRLTHICKEQLEEYFTGKRTTFDIPFILHGTEFQKQVWNALLTVPFGETATYTEQSIKINNVKAVRAVGAANGKNVINIIVPCHRIIGANGSLTGYGGGIERKQWLLEHERKISQKTLL